MKKLNCEFVKPFLPDWYMVTTYYYPDGTTYRVEEYLYTTYYDDCGGGCTPTEDNLYGGSPGDPGTAVSHQVELIVWHEQVGQEDWKISGTFTLTGFTFSNTPNNYFTSISLAILPANPGITYYLPNATGLSPLFSWYSVYHLINYSNGLLSPTLASASMAAQMTYPNNLDQNGNVIPVTKYYQKGQTWQASVDLY